MRPFVKEVDAGHLHLLWRHEPDREIPHQSDAEQREWVFLDKMKQN